MLDCFVARAVHRQCSAEMPVRAGRIRSESSGLAKFTNRLVDVPFLGEREAKRVVQLGGIGYDGTKICAASDRSRLTIRELAHAGHFTRRRRVGAAKKREIRIEPFGGRNNPAAGE